MTQTVLDATGQIVVEIARELGRATNAELRLLCPNPRTVNDGDVLAPAR